MKTLFISFPFLFVAALIVYAQGSFGEFAIWNWLPVAAALGAMIIGLRLRDLRARAAFITFSVVATLLPALFHLAWLFDWGGTSTGSSTSALAFIFVPIWAAAFAAIAAVIVWCIALYFPQP